MSYTVNEKRQQTMLNRIGEAAELIDDIRYLPFYRSIQIRLEKMGKADEWAKMIASAKEANSPSRYFAKLCKMVRDNTYHFAEKIKKIAGETALFLHDKLVKFGFGKYQKYWIHKANEFINKNSLADFVDLLEYANKKGVSQKYMAKALINCKPMRDNYRHNLLGGAE